MLNRWSPLMLVVGVVIGYAGPGRRRACPELGDSRHAW
jgi:hypothetical protein